MDTIPFNEYYRRFEAAAHARNATLTRLQHGGSIATFGAGPRFALMSGLHGDERSGPLGILGWLEDARTTDLVPPGYELWIAPLVNDDGWDSHTREWRGRDLNRAFDASAPPFLQQIMTSLSRHLPCISLDLHEDSDRPELYIYHHVADRHGVDIELARHLSAVMVDWSDATPWQGTGEVFLRNQGCARAITVEIPPPWPLDERVACARRAVEWLSGHLASFC